MDTNINLLLQKIAIDKARRLFGLGVLSKVVGEAPSAAKTGHKAVLEGYGLGQPQSPLSGVGSIISGANKVANNLASARLYRMNRVAGKSRAESAANLQEAILKRKISKPVNKAKKMVKDTKSLGSGAAAFKGNVGGLGDVRTHAKSIGKGLKSAFDLVTGKTTAGI
jgi:hypothetical protein